MYIYATNKLNEAARDDHPEDTPSRLCSSQSPVIVIYFWMDLHEIIW
jgi:hypothetical protein